MRQQRNMFQMKEQGKNLKEQSEIEINNVLNKELKVMNVKLLNKLQRKKFNKELGNIKKKNNGAEEYND